MPQSHAVLDRLRQLGIELPDRLESQGLYQTVVVEGGLAYVSGQTSRFADGSIAGGRVRADGDLEDAKSAARLSLARALLALHQELGDMERIRRFISLKGYVNAEPGFARHGEVIDAASSLALELFGQDGRHARTSLGVGSLPANALVELDVIVSLKN